MRKTNKLFVLVLIAVTVFSFAGCGIFNNNIDGNSGPHGPQSGFNKDMLKGYKIDLTGVSSIGLVGVSGKTNQAAVYGGELSGALNTAKLGASGEESLSVALSSVVRLADGDEDRSYLATFDEEGQPEVVEFVKEDSTNEIKTQDDMVGEIDKMYITGDFIFMRYKNEQVTWWDWERDNNPNYDKVSYECNWSFQSFVVYKPTGKIYALSDLAPAPMTNEYDIPQISVDIKDGNIISLRNHMSGGSQSFYELSVDGDTLKATNILPNTNIQVQDIMADKFGNTYVRMSTGEQTTSGKRLYYSHNNFYKGDDGFVYELKEEKISLLDGGWRYAHSLKQFNANREPIAVPEGTKAYLTQGDYYGNGGWLVNGDFMFQVHWESMSVYYKGPKGYESCGWMNMGSDGSWEQKIFPYLGELFVITTENGIKKLTHFDLDGLTAPEFEYQYRDSKDWNNSFWVDEERVLGANEYQWVGGYYATEPYEYVEGHYAYVDGTPWNQEIHGGLEWKNVYNDAHYVDKDGVRVDWLQGYWVDVDGVKAEWIEGRHYGPGETVPKYQDAPHVYSEDDPEWDVYYIRHFSDMLDFGTRTPITSATSAYMQRGQMYVVVDTIFSRDISTIEFIDGEIVVVNASSATFGGTVITILPLN